MHPDLAEIEHAVTQIRHDRGRRLQSLVAHAKANSRFYATHYAGVDPSAIGGIPDLNLLPTIRKSDVAADPLSFLVSNSIPTRLGVSSGTTYTGDPSKLAMFFQSRADLGLQMAMRARSGPRPYPLAISLISAMHGGQGIPPPDGVFEVGLLKPFHVDVIRRLLSMDFEFDGFSRRVQVIVGSLSLLQLLSLLIQRDPSSFRTSGLTSIHSYASLLSPRWRSILESTFAVPVIDTFGVSEVAGSACTRCPDCGAFHPTELVVAEVLSPSADRPAAAHESGELTLTSLLPSAQPLIRYRTGDLVTRSYTCAGQNPNSPAFVPLGRLAQSAFSDDGSLLLPAGVVQVALDDQQEVARSHTEFRSDFGLGPVYGKPKYRVTRRDLGAGVLGLLVEVELVFEPSHFPSVSAALRSRVESTLKSCTPEIVRSLGQGSVRLDLEFCGPGTLSSWERIK